MSSETCKVMTTWKPNTPKNIEQSYGIRLILGPFQSLSIEQIKLLCHMSCHDRILGLVLIVASPSLSFLRQLVKASKEQILEKQAVLGQPIIDYTLLLALSRHLQ